jgi:hypothetical protein
MEGTWGVSASKRLEVCVVPDKILGTNGLWATSQRVAGAIRSAILLPDAATRVQTFVADSNRVLVNLGTRQDTAPYQARDWRIAAELKLIKWRIVFVKFHAEAGFVLRVLVIRRTNPPYFLVPAFANVKVLRIDFDFSVAIKPNHNDNVPIF